MIGDIRGRVTYRGVGDNEDDLVTKCMVIEVKDIKKNQCTANFSFISKTLNLHICEN